MAFVSKFLKCSTIQLSLKFGTYSRPFPIDTAIGRSVQCIQALSAEYSTVSIENDAKFENCGKFSFAKELACLIDESSDMSSTKPKGRMELKRCFENRIKKRVKDQHENGKFKFLMEKVISNPETLQDAYDCVRLNSNITTGLEYVKNSIENLAEELVTGRFDVHANIFSISTRGENKQTLVLPNLRLKVVQEAIRIVLEVIYKPHFSKISHGCRSGRGHATALKYIRKEMLNPDWWFTLSLNRKLDASVLAKLIEVMEERIQDPSLFDIIRNMFDAQVLNLEFGGFPKGHGLPQEGLLSPILMNIYLDLFDREFYRLSMNYEAINPSFHGDLDISSSKLRGWFRRQLKGGGLKCAADKPCHLRVYCCRVMDEFFFAVSGSKDSALSLKSEIHSYLKGSLLLDVLNESDISPCEESNGIRFLGNLVKRRAKQSTAVKAVHKLKEKVQLFALQKQEIWDSWNARMGKKWLGHGLRKVKESEIKHLANNNSILSKISCFRKSGMETDHWFKILLKIWMQDIQAKKAKSEEMILSKYISESALPQELKNCFDEFQMQVDRYLSSETALTLALLQRDGYSEESVAITEILAPVNAIKKRLLRYGLTTSQGYPRSTALLILQETDEIIDWYAGLIYRWLRWYSYCDNFDEVKQLFFEQVRKSCICTLATKYRVHEREIERRFDSELSRIPLNEEMQNEITDNTLETQVFDNDEALTYGISHSGMCLLSLARIVSQSRPCTCFVFGCLSAAPSVYTLHVMERQRFPGWKTGFSTCIHPSLNGRKIGLCKQHMKDLYVGNISLQSIDFGAWNHGSDCF